MTFTLARSRAAHLTASVLCAAFLFVSCGRKGPAASAPIAGEHALPFTELAVNDPDNQKRLLRGFSEGAAGWKWTGQTFAVSLDAPEWHGRTRLVLDFGLPGELMDQHQTVTLTAKVNGIDAGNIEYKKTGQYSSQWNVPANAFKSGVNEIEFSLDHAGKFPDGRPLGVNAIRTALMPTEEQITDRETQVRMARAGYQKILAERNRKLSPEQQTGMVKLFHEIPVWRNIWFHNVEIEKNPLDLWMMQEIIYQLQPDFIIETGTWRGGSALYWAHTLNGAGLEKSRVLTVDIQDVTKTSATHPLWKKYVTFFLGSSTDPKIVGEIAKLVQGKKVLITLDSDHHRDHVLNELRAYSPMVSARSYVVVEDTHMDGVPTYPDFGPGPYAAVQAFLSEGGSKDFEPDLAREAFLMTFNPGGWLRRK